MPDTELPEPSNATVIFVLGLLGILVCGVLGIIAFFMGKTYKQQVAQGLVKSNGLADAGYILGLISFIILILQIIIVIVMVGAMFAVGTQMPPVPVPPGIV